MKKFKFIIYLSILLFICNSCKGRWVEASAPHLDTIECLGVGKAYGTIQLGIWVYANSVEDALKIAQSQAIKDITFGKKKIEGQGCPAQPIISNITQMDTKTHEEVMACFEKVLQENPPKDFVTSVYFGQDRFRESARKIKFKVYLTLDHDQLRQKLEEAGCAKKLADYK